MATPGPGSSYVASTQTSCGCWVLFTCDRHAAGCVERRCTVRRSRKEPSSHTRRALSDASVRNETLMEGTEMAERLNDQDRKLLQGTNFAHLTTLAPDGSPRTTVMW